MSGMGCSSTVPQSVLPCLPRRQDPQAALAEVGGKITSGWKRRCCATKPIWPLRSRMFRWSFRQACVPSPREDPVTALCTVILLFDDALLTAVGTSPAPACQPAPPLICRCWICAATSTAAWPSWMPAGMTPFCCPPVSAIWGWVMSKATYAAGLRRQPPANGGRGGPRVPRR